MVALGQVPTGSVTEARIEMTNVAIRLACQRATPEELDAMEADIDHHAALFKAGQGSRNTRALTEFYRLLAKATHNELIHAQMRWWLSFARDRRLRGTPIPPPPTPIERGFYAALTKALATHKGAVELYLMSIGPMLDRFDQQRANDGKG